MALPDAIRVAFQAYCDIGKRTKQRQDTWQHATKEMVYRTLSLLKDELLALKVSESPIYVEKDESTHNLELVAFGFRPLPTNIVIARNRTQVGVIKSGGFLSYAQTTNGMVHVELGIPVLKEIDQKDKTETFALIPPEEISPEVIYQHVEHFLKAIAKAEGL